MTTVERHAPSASRVLRHLDEAVAHVRDVCFTTGPPGLIGVELEWTVHHVDAPARDLDVVTLRAALGPHAPPTLDPTSPHRPLPHGSVLTVEPGGQVEISTRPFRSLTELHRITEADLAYVIDRLAAHGLRLGRHGIDAYRHPRRLLRTRRYDAMAARFAAQGPAGLTMMCATAAIQVNLDAGEPDQVGQRWRTLQALGPVLLALFATSRRHAGVDTGWASARMRAWLEMEPERTAPVRLTGDPATDWAQYALAAPVLCLRHGADWRVPVEMTFADWIADAFTPPPTIGDLDYHLSTLFPPVRPRGHLEVRYLDAQEPSEWFPPVALLVALLADPVTTVEAGRLAAPVAHAWRAAARVGLAAPALARVAAAVVDLAAPALARTDLAAATRRTVVEALRRRLAGGKE